MRSSIPAEKLGADQYWRLDRYPTHMQYNALGFSNMSRIPVYGLTMMFIMAGLANDIPTFDDRDRALGDLPPSALAYMIEHNKQRLTAKIVSLKQEVQKMGPEGSTQLLNEMVEAERNKQHYLDQALLSAEAFYGAVALLDGAPYYSDIFNTPLDRHDQRMNVILPIITPESVLEKGGVKEISTFLGSYNHEELYITLASLRHHLISNYVNVPVALMLSSGMNCTALIFDPKMNGWYHYDSTKFTSKQLDSKSAAKMIHEAHTSNQYAILRCQILTTGHHAAMLTELYKSWKQQPAIKSIHEFRQEHALRTDSLQMSLLHHACNSSMTTQVHHLLAMGADPNMPYTIKKCSLLQSTLEIRSEQCALALINHPRTNVECFNENFDRPIHIAIRFGLLESFRALLQRGVNLYQANKDGITPAQLIHTSCDKRFHAILYPATTPATPAIPAAQRFFKEKPKSTRDRKRSKKARESEDSPYIQRKHH